MRYILALMTALILGGIAWSASASAASLPVPSARAFCPSPVTVEPVAYWRRYCRFHDCTAPQVNVTVDASAPVVNPDNPAIIAIVPVRPVSCGEFHYWNGSACVDARYNNPYVGPR
jgi:hypothetical protein